MTGACGVLVTSISITWRYLGDPVHPELGAVP